MKKGMKKENGKIHKISIRLTEEEYEMILTKSKNKNLTMSKYILNLVKKEK